MTKVWKLARTVVTVLQTYNEQKGKVTDERISSCCRELRYCLPALWLELSDGAIYEDSPKASRYVSLCLTAGLVENLVPFLIHLESWDITSTAASPSEQLRLQTWEDVMSVLTKLVSRRVEGSFESSQQSRRLVEGFLPSNEEPPGGGVDYYRWQTMSMCFTNSMLLGQGGNTPLPCMIVSPWHASTNQHFH
jgi:hypothetical protein